MTFYPASRSRKGPMTDFGSVQQHLVLGQTDGLAHLTRAHNGYSTRGLFPSGGG